MLRSCESGRRPPPSPLPTTPLFIVMKASSSVPVVVASYGSRKEIPDIYRTAAFKIGPLSQVCAGPKGKVKNNCAVGRHGNSARNKQQWSNLLGGKGPRYGNGTLQDRGPQPPRKAYVDAAKVGKERAQQRESKRHKNK